MKNSTLLFVNSTGMTIGSMCGLIVKVWVVGNTDNESINNAVGNTILILIIALMLAIIGFWHGDKLDGESGKNS